MESFKAIVLREDNNEVVPNIETVDLDSLSGGTEVIKVSYSSVNYKDMLAFQTKGGVVRTYPMIPGIDLSGTIISSKSNSFLPGDKVLVAASNVGVDRTGGYSEIARVDASNVIKIPSGLSEKGAMLLGTAGLTAGLSIEALEKAGMSKDHNPRIVVTGASGGVGSVALLILKKAGYTDVTAVVRKDYQVSLVSELGATSVLMTKDIDKEKRLLSKQSYDYIIDTVGGELTSLLIPSIATRGAISVCGNAGGVALDTNMLPFILRGIKLIGIDCVSETKEVKEQVWSKLSNEWNITSEISSQEVCLEDVGLTVKKLREGTHTGRTVVKL